MNWLTLTFAEVAAFSAVASGLALWLYLRQPRSLRLRVSTLRFWENASTGASARRKLKLREPWPFVAQIIFLLAAIAAFGNPRLGAVFHESRSVAIVIDPSAWSQMQPRGSASWLEEIRKQALDVLGNLPSGDRVLLMRADADGGPILPFTADRAAAARAIQNLRSSSAVPDVPRALAEGLAGLSDSSRGLLVYVGPGIMNDKQVQELARFRNTLQANGGTRFLVRLVEGSAPLADRGITRLALKRGEESPDQWSLLTELRNYDATTSEATLNLAVNGQVFRREKVTLRGDGSTAVTDYFTSPSGGVLQAEITPGDELDADNRAAIELPSSQPASVAVLTDRDAFIDKLRAVLSSNPYVRADFIVPGAYPKSDVMIYDGAVPAGAPAANTISFPPVQGGTLRRVRLANWNTEHPVTRWIQSRDVSVRAAGPVELQSGDVVLASSEGATPEPLIVAREQNGFRSVIVGFDPLDSNFTVEPAFPLLMAASIEWMTQPVGDQGESLNAGAIDLAAPVASITAPSGQDVPFARNGNGVHFFAGESGRYRLKESGGTSNLMVNVPPLPTERWKPVAQDSAAIEAEPVSGEQRDLWRWLVGLALLAIWLEWRLFYFVRVKVEGRTRSAASARSMGRSDDAGDLGAETAGKSAVRTS